MAVVGNWQGSSELMKMLNCCSSSDKHRLNEMKGIIFFHEE